VLASLRRWRPIHLVSTWIAYWVVLLAVAVIPPLLAFLRIPRGPGEHSSINVGFGDGMFTASVKYFDAVKWSGSIHFLPLALLIAGPPLALFAAWLAARRREHERGAELRV